MKKILISLAFAAFSCSNCNEVVEQYQQAETIHQQKVAEASDLYVQLESIPMDSIQDHSLIEDELIMVLIDIATIEIEMEDWKKQHVECLHSY